MHNDNQKTVETVNKSAAPIHTGLKPGVNEKYSSMTGVNEK